MAKLKLRPSASGHKSHSFPKVMPLLFALLGPNWPALPGLLGKSKVLAQKTLILISVL